MIYYPGIADMEKKAECGYTLVCIVSKRARQIIDGGMPLVHMDVNKPVTVATNELHEGKVIYREPENKEATA